jgi:hypothetical protein
MARTSILPARSIDVSDTAAGMLLHILEIFLLRKADALTAKAQTTCHGSAHRSLRDPSGYLSTVGEHSACEAVLATIARSARDIG